MKKKPYLPRTEADRVIWLNNFSAKIGTYANSLGITNLEVAAIIAMALFYSYMITLIAASRAFTKSLTNFKNTLSFAPNGTVLGTIPVFDPGSAPPPTQAGIFNYISGIVQRIKGNTAVYTVTIGEALRIIGEETIFVPADYIANGNAVSALHYVAVGFDKAHLDGMDIYSLPIGSTDVSLFEKIGTVSFSPFHDTRPLVVPGKPEKRFYQNIGVIHDSEIGHPSEVFSVIFEG